MEALQYIQTEEILLILLSMALGCAIGSFLNVVCYRLPKMMEREWRAQSLEMLGMPPEQTETFNLAFPPSRCPQCGHGIRAWENIPVVSYLFLRGCCAGCKTAISKRYPLVEALCGVLSGIVVWRFGLSWQCAAVLGLTWSLLTLALIDFDTKILPDDITLPLLWAGLLFSLTAAGFTSLRDAVLGAAAGYLILWSVYWIFRLITGREGMGYGDFKLLAALGAWLGWQAIPQILLLSSVTGALLGISMIVFRGRDRQIPMPFGPYLATAGWVSLLWGNDINHWYLNNFSHLSNYWYMGAA